MGAHVLSVRESRAKTPRAQRRIPGKELLNAAIEHFQPVLFPFATPAVRPPPQKTFVKLVMGRCTYAKGAIRKRRVSCVPTNITNMLVELRAERQLIEESILVLERLASGGGPRRGRPPKWMSKTSTKRRGRPPGSKNRTKDGLENA